MPTAAAGKACIVKYTVENSSRYTVSFFLYWGPDYWGPDSFCSPLHEPCSSGTAGYGAAVNAQQMLIFGGLRARARSPDHVRKAFRFMSKLWSETSGCQKRKDHDLYV